MKNKYERLSKEEKKEACNNFKNSDENKDKVYEKLTRARVLGIIGIIYGFISMLVDILLLGPTVWQDIYFAGVIFICLIIFYYASKERVKFVNAYLINEMKKAYSEEKKKEEKKKSKKK